MRYLDYALANERRTSNDRYITSRRHNTCAGFHPFLKPLQNQSVGIISTTPERSSNDIKFDLFKMLVTTRPSRVASHCPRQERGPVKNGRNLHPH
jgi:hypothetical protein